MNTVPTNPTHIALVTDDLAKVELIEDALECIARWDEKYHGVGSFGQLKMTRYSSAKRADTKLFSIPAERAALKLVVLDGTVRKENTGGTLSNNVAAMALLDWLTDNMPAAPVIVLASNRVEGLDLRISRREQSNIRTLDIAEADFAAEFARVLHGLLPGTRAARTRVALRVREFSARRYTLNGKDLIKGPLYEYRNLTELRELLNSANEFSPMANGKVQEKWPERFGKLGDDVYSSLIRGTIGEHIAGLYRQKKEREESKARLEAGTDTGPSSELRFDFAVKENGTSLLYALPFELVRPTADEGNFLCTRVPMARRIHFIKTRKHRVTEDDDDTGDVIQQQIEDDDEDEEDDPDSLPSLLADEPVRPKRPLRVLFINASFAGGTVIDPEKPGDKVQIIGLHELANTPDELKAVRSFASKKKDGSPPLLEPVTVVNSAAYKTAQKFQERIEYLVKKYSFDILHFSGHSTTLSEDRGTFFVLPDASGVGKAVSVRVMAEWVQAAGVRLVLLSSCSGSSLRTTIEIMRTNAEAVLGFRYDVDDYACVEYFKRFYHLYLEERKTVPEAYCGACSKAHSATIALPIWASAIAVVKN
jgi:hypothetical protein